MLDPRQPLRVRMGDLAVHDATEAPGGLAVYGLGSCVAVFLHDRGRRIGGLAHVLLPEPRSSSPASTAPARFAGGAVEELLRAILARGTRRHRLVAKVAGGARMFDLAAPEREGLGARNVRAALEALRLNAIPVAAVDVGGTAGRTIVADLESGAMTITGLSREPRVL